MRPRHLSGYCTAICQAPCPPIECPIKTGICIRCVLLHCYLTLNAPIATKVICSSRLLKCLRSLYGKQCGPRSDCYTLFASILNSSVMLGNYLQQTTSADNILDEFFFLTLQGLPCDFSIVITQPNLNETVLLIIHLWIKT